MVLARCFAAMPEDVPAALHRYVALRQKRTARIQDTARRNTWMRGPTDTEPSPVVAQLFHSALLSSNQGPLGPHPRAKPGSPYDAFPLVQLGDVFVDATRTKAIVVLSAKRA